MQALINISPSDLHALKMAATNFLELAARIEAGQPQAKNKDQEQQELRERANKILKRVQK